MYVHFPFPISLFKKNKKENQPFIIYFAFSIHLIFMHTIFYCSAQRNLFLIFSWKHTCSIKLVKCVFFLHQAPELFVKSSDRWVFFFFFFRCFLCLCLPSSPLHTLLYPPTPCVHSQEDVTHFFLHVRIIWGDHSLSVYKFSLFFVMIICFPLYIRTIICYQFPV